MGPWASGLPQKNRRGVGWKFTAPFPVGGHDHAVARWHYVCSWSKVRGEQDFLSDGNCAHGCALSLLLTGASAS